ncbi:MAG: ABC transporter ATP-binding protein [Thermoplasmata archaeon]|nr:ABC transporter ATP-binding protein [Thermoplasmata archaeon]
MAQTARPLPANGGRPPPPSVDAMAPASGGPPVLEVRGLSKRYKPRKRGSPTTLANDGLNLSVGRGEIVALLGPNGAGKTTLLRQIAGQLLPDGGTIRIAGVDMIARPLAAKERLSVIPQECASSESLTVRETVLLFGRIKGLERKTATQRTQEILVEVGLQDESEKLVRELSGGLKRRVLIAVAMSAPAAELLLLDEPTTGLDPEARRSVWRVILGLKRRGLSILLTTHYIEEAEYLADRVVVVTHGRFVVHGRVEEIRAGLPYQGRLEVRALDRLSPEARRRVDALGQRWKEALRSDSYVRFEIPDPFSRETVSELGELTSLGVRASLSPVSLEDAYLAVVGAVEE